MGWGKYRDGQSFPGICAAKPRDGFAHKLDQNGVGAVGFGKAEGKMRSRDSQMDNQKRKVKRKVKVEKERKF